MHPPGQDSCGDVFAKIGFGTIDHGMTFQGLTVGMVYSHISFHSFVNFDDGFDFYIQLVLKFRCVLTLYS